jgi:hypothetical protein
MAGCLWLCATDYRVAIVATTVHQITQWRFLLGKLFKVSYSIEVTLNKLILGAND